MCQGVIIIYLLNSSVVNGDEIEEKLKLLREMKEELIKQKEEVSKKKHLLKNYRH